MTLVQLKNFERAITDLSICIFFLSLIYVIYLLRNYFRALILAFKLQGPPTVPLLGSSHLMYHDNVFDDDLKKKCYTSRIVKVWITVIPFIGIINPDDIQIVLGSMKHNSKPFPYTLFRGYLGNGLIVNGDETWKHHRRIIHTAFNTNGLERFMKIFAKYAEELLLEIFDKTDKDMNITKMINDIVYNIQAESILGLKTRKKWTKEEEDSLPFKKNEQFASYRLVRPWLLIDWIYERTNTSKTDMKQLQDNASIIDRILKKTEESMRKNSCCNEQKENCKGTKEWSSLLEYMIECKEKYPQFTDKDINDECCTFMLAGLESVSTATAITIFMLANHKEWQEKCVDEISAILKNSDTSFTSTEALKEMKCLEMCIKESLRLYPSVPIFSRRLNEDEKLCGYVVPAGCKILISPFVTHRLPNYFPEPEAFKPERFDPTNSKIHPYAYLPFSAGPRNCIGYKYAMLEIKIIVSTILRNFILEPIEGKNTVQPRYRMTLRARGGLWVRFKARTETTCTH